MWHHSKRTRAPCSSLPGKNCRLFVSPVHESHPLFLAWKKNAGAQFGQKSFEKLPTERAPQLLKFWHQRCVFFVSGSVILVDETIWNFFRPRTWNSGQMESRIGIVVVLVVMPRTALSAGLGPLLHNPVPCSSCRALHCLPALEAPFTLHYTFEPR